MYSVGCRVLGIVRRVYVQCRVQGSGQCAEGIGRRVYS